MPFNIIVCLKAVPDPEKASSLTMDPKTKTLRRGQVPLVINPLDKNALEAGLELKELYGGKVTVLSMGPPEAADCLKEALALEWMRLSSFPIRPSPVTMPCHRFHPGRRRQKLDLPAGLVRQRKLRRQHQPGRATPGSDADTAY